MPVPQILLSALLLSLLAAPVFAADSPQRACLNKAEQRAAVADRKAIKLAQAVKTLRERGYRGELVKARLCRRDEALVYVLTLLARNGKVTRATVDAENGELINGR